MKTVLSRFAHCERGENHYEKVQAWTERCIFKLTEPHEVDKKKSRNCETGKTNFLMD